MNVFLDLYTLQKYNLITLNGFLKKNDKTSINEYIAF